MQNKDDSLKGKDQEQTGQHKEKGKIMEGEVDESLPPGFRFHPTDEELITYYLINKISDSSFTGRAIGDVDLNKSEPWDLPGKAKMGEKEWYFFSRRDRKYPTGVRTNRATNTGYWKTTGKDREIYNGVTSELVGMKKTLVFYRGRAPRGEKSNWVMHEYRIHSKSPFRTTKEEWVVCRVFQKSVGIIKKYPPIPNTISVHQQQHQHQHQLMRANIPYNLEIGSMQPPMLMHQVDRNYMNNAELAELTRVLRSSPQLNSYPNMVGGSGFTISGLNLNLGGSAPQQDQIVTASNNNNNAAMMHAGYDITGGPSNRPYNMTMDNCVDLDGYWPSYN